MSFPECEAYYRRSSRNTRAPSGTMAELRRVDALADAAGKSAVNGPGHARESTRPVARRRTEVALLTGGADTPYAFGLGLALMSRGIGLDIIAGDELDRPHFHGTAGVNFLNLRGNQATSTGLWTKISRVLRYYGRLIRYASIARPRVFHILWNNKFETLDRTLLMLYYKALGKKIVLTVHNVNAGRRDSHDTALNRLTLRIQYRLADHCFVHTDSMKKELIADFHVRESAITVIPFGINNAVPDTAVTSAQARERLGIGPGERAILFFGTIAPYKGLEYLVAAFERLLTERSDYRLIIAGRPRNGSEQYWETIRRTIQGMDQGRMIQKIEFKAADVLILPYTEIFQSGVLFLGYSFGLPAIVADVGSLGEDIVEGKTGCVFRAGDPVDLARVIEIYFASDLYKALPSRRQQIRDLAEEQHSWDTVGRMTETVYEALLT
jgi:D-inositol-3-phosphate glycosyltransferase